MNHSNTPIRLVSISGGKDSTATLLLALERHPHEEVRAAFADTGNEHESTYDYVRHLGDKLGVHIEWIKQDFTDWWWRRRDYVRDVWPRKLVEKEGMSEAEAAEAVARVLDVLEAGPTGNPFLDLCIIKGRFPSRRAQFCTQFLKTEPLTEYALALIELHGAVESWQGVRAEESPSRAALPEREDRGGGLTIYRPIHKWTVAEVFEQHRKHGIEPNPLYTQGMGRVGCMPCINANKDELLEISKRFPQHIDRIEKWERAVGLACKRSFSTFFAGANNGEGLSSAETHARANIRQMVEWSQTRRGGVEYDWIRLHEEPAACASAYGLCE